MHYVATGIVLVAVADLTRELKAFVGGGARKSAVEAAESRSHAARRVSTRRPEAPGSPGAFACQGVARGPLICCAAPGTAPRGVVGGPDSAAIGPLRLAIHHAESARDDRGPRPTP